jgi:CO/xanthine dehydrogenase FAD-binding subunit
VDFLAPTSWAEALVVRAERPDALVIAGGTDVMVDMNFGRVRPAALLDLRRVPELAAWQRISIDGREWIRLGAGVTYTTVIAELADLLPGLALASRTVGSPQIRNRGTVGGNLGSASPAGDALPPLLADDAVVEVASVRGTRDVPIEEFFVGVKRHVLDPDELIEAVRIPLPSGPQQFAKVGTRNAMVIAVVSFSLALHPTTGRVGTGIGSAAPTPRRAKDAERFLADALAQRWSRPDPIPDDVAARFADLVASAAAPIDDVRGTAAYRRHALAVLARRTLSWAWTDYQAAA